VNPPRVRELTARGSGGVAVLELSGARAVERIAAHLSRPAPAPGGLSLARLSLGGEVLDEVLVYRAAPERLELHLHGSPPLVARVRALLAQLGWHDGELRGVARSLEQRAMELVPHAPSAAGARMLLDQAAGALRAELGRIAQLSGEPRAAAIQVLRERARLARRLLEPARVVLAGPVNAGKSTLFNALVGSQRALVSGAAGTTRDLLCEPARIGDWPILLCDTAGERALDPRWPARGVEAQGQELGRGARRSADVVLWLESMGEPPTAAPANALLLATRADLAPQSAPRAASQAQLAAGPDPLGAARQVGEILRRALRLPESAHQPGAGVPFEAWMLERLDRDGPELLDELSSQR
jgi:tRNA modification GTPase